VGYETFSGENKMQRTQAEVIAQVALFVAALQVFCNEANINKNIYSYVMSMEIGKKNIRIVQRELWAGQEEPTNGSVHCFIDMATGNILKADGWKRPAPQVRGSIFNANFDIGKAVGQYGAVYLR
jgi:hypothetical protein